MATADGSPTTVDLLEKGKIQGLMLQEAVGQGIETVSSGALASRGGTTSAQVRKDLSFFGSFGKRGLGYPVPELADRLREDGTPYAVAEEILKDLG